MAGEKLDDVLGPLQGIFGGFGDIVSAYQAQVREQAAAAKDAADSLNKVLQSRDKVEQDAAKGSQAAAKAQAAVVAPAQASAKSMEALVLALNKLILKMGGTLDAVPPGPAKAATLRAAPGGAATPQGKLPDLALAAPDTGGGGLGGIGAMLGPLGAAAGAAAAALANVVSSTAGFVQALSPGTMLAFSQSVRDLQATIGVAFEPIFQVLTGVMRQAAGVIMPLMEQLRPVIEAVTQAMGTRLMDALSLVVSVIDALLPVFEVLFQVGEAVYAAFRPVILIVQMLVEYLAGMFQIWMAILQPVFDSLKFFGAVMDGLVQVMRVVITVMKAVFLTITNAIKAMFGGSGVQDAMKGLQDVVNNVIRGMLLFVATLAKAFGMNDFLKNLMKGLEPKKGAAAAIEGVSIKSFDAISKDMDTASAGAAQGAGGEQKQSQEDYMKETLALMGKIATGEKIDGLVGKLETLIAVANKIADKVGAVKEAGKSMVRAGGVALNVMNPLAFAAGKLLGR